jgi:hypothetical protein
MLKNNIKLFPIFNLNIINIFIFGFKNLKRFEGFSFFLVGISANLELDALE